ncbi:hypothetical protein [Oceanicaulis sp.]|uniref:hypothetical protein n=1 Tax=Oceanicaulis sp. TaxID=1924941 RepID=UPI003F7122A2
MSKPSYNFIDATFYFLKVFGQRPLSVAWIGLWQVLLYAGFGALMLYGFWPLLEMALEYGGKGDPSDAEMAQAALQGMGFYMLGILGILISALMIQGAWLRLLARDQVVVGLPIRLGADELRLLVVNIVIWLLMMAAGVLTIMLFAVVNAGLTMGGQPGGVAVQALVNTLLTVIVIVGWIIFLLGLAPATSLTVRQRGIKIFDGFAAAQGVMFWMFLSYVVLFFAILMAYVVLSVMQQAFMMIGSSELVGALISFEQTSDPDLMMEALLDALDSPLFWAMAAIVLILQLIFDMFVQGSWQGVGAYVAVRHDGGFAPDTPLEAPAESVGQAPSEG